MAGRLLKLDPASQECVEGAAARKSFRTGTDGVDGCAKHTPTQGAGELGGRADFDITRRVKKSN